MNLIGEKYISEKLKLKIPAKAGLIFMKCLLKRI